MATGIIATLAASSSITYKPSANAKVKITAASNTTSGSGVTVNGVMVLHVYFGSGYPANWTCEFYVAAGVAVTIATTTSITAIVSALEAA